jgi:hypothetical protein
VIRAALATVALVTVAVGGAAHAGPPRVIEPAVRPEPSARPAAAPPPDGTGEAVRREPADSRRIVGILELRADGVPDEAKDTFQRGLEQQIDPRRYVLTDRARMKQMMMHSTKWTDGCVVGQCLAEVRAQTRADLVVLAALTGSGTSFGYVVTLVRTDTGRVLRQESERCDVCTVDEAMGKAMRATSALLDKLPEKLPDEGAEQGAAFDREVGRIKQELAARDRRNTRLGIALAVVGLAAAVGGGALYAIDDKPYAAMIVAGGGTALASGIVVLTF